MSQYGAAEKLIRVCQGLLHQEVEDELRWSKVRILEMVRIVAHIKNSCRSELFCYLWWYAFAMSLYGKV